MVPSRSRKTARCFGGVSGTARLLQPLNRGGANVGGLDARHAAMIDRAFAQKTRAACHGMANNRATLRPRRGPLWIRRANNADDRNAHGSRDVHRPGIVANEKLAA